MRVDETLARGQTYYNGVVYEFFDTNPDNNRSIFGGGRYDNLTALFEDFEMPAVGIASGDVPMQNFLETHSLLPAYKPATNLFLVSKDTEVEKVIAFFGMVHTLQEAGLNIATDKSGRDNGDLYKVAERLHIPFIGFAEGDMLTVKNMLTREEKQFNSSDVQAIKDFITA
jgi:histidyl-tRNA synthetase